LRFDSSEDLFPVCRFGGNISGETMSDRDDQLIAEFNARRSEDAFAALVRQHVNLVFATALRQVGDAGAAEEITQNVFVALAQAAGRLGSHPTIAGWLHQTALNKSREWLRSELRRRHREEVAVNLELAAAEGDSVWLPLVPLLDEALLKLREPDRQAVILHFMEGRTFQEVGSALGVGEDTVRKRVNRCLDELAHFFRRRGFAVPTLSATATLFALSSHVAPAGLAASATTAGLAAAHSAASTSTLTLIKGALKIMAWTKAKSAIVAGVVVLLAAGTTTVTVKEVHRHENSEWDIGRVDGRILQNGPHVVRIITSKFPNKGLWASIGDGRIIGLGSAAADIVRAAYGNPTKARTILLTKPPKRKYDFIANLPSGSNEALKQEIKKQFGIVARREMIETNVLFLRIKTTGAPGLQPTKYRHPPSYSQNDGALDISNQKIGSVINLLEFDFGIPVIDQTGLTGNYDVHLKWTSPDDGQHTHLKQALNDQLGLGLVPGTAPVEMLVVEKAK
jgi:uncharacterized protein (TIGR03435 family)